MRKWSILQFNQLNTGSSQDFEIKLPGSTRKIIGISFYSEDYHLLDRDKVNLQISMFSNNQRVFNGNPVFCLGVPDQKYKELNPEFITIDQEIEDTMVNGHVKVVSNFRGEPFNLRMYIKTE